MRILHMIGSLEMGGAQTMVMALYRSIDRTKTQFDFVIDSDVQSVFVDEIQELGGKIYSFPKFNGKNYGEVCSAWNVFFRNHPEYKILHSHVRSYASIFLPIAKSHGLKTMIHSHNTSNGKGIIAIAKKILQYPLRFQADYFFGCSEIAGQWLFGKKVIKSGRYFMLKNAVDIERFTYRQETRKRIRKELGIAENDLVIGHIGRMHPQKNHKFLLDCFCEIAKQRNDAKLLLLGDGELRGDILAHIQHLDLEKRVLLLGIQKKPEEYLSAMDCMMLPSLHEGLPVVVVEAQANGLHCFVSDTVTKEVQLSHLVKYLPITEGTAPWVNAVLSCDYRHEDVATKIKAGGFCVKSTAQWLCDFYQSIVN